MKLSYDYRTLLWLLPMIVVNVKANQNILGTLSLKKLFLNQLTSSRITHIGSKLIEMKSRDNSLNDNRST